MRKLKHLFAATMAAATVAAQQPNTFGATMTIDSVNGPTYPMLNVPVRTNTVSDITVSGFGNQPFLIALGNAGQIQQFSAPMWGDKLDLPFNPPVTVWLNGFWGPGIATFKTGILGSLLMPISIPSNMPLNSNLSFQAAIADFTSSFGLSLTAATQTLMTQGPVITNHSLGDSGTATITLSGWTYPIYGTNYTNLFVDADGYMTMGGTTSDFSSSPSQMTAGPPRVAGFWADLDQVAGVIRTTVDANPPGDFPYVLVEYISVSDWSGVGFTHTFSYRVNSQGWVDITSAFNNNLSIFETLVCLAPGNNNNIGVMLNMSDVQDLPPFQKIGAINEQFYEWFGQTTMPSYSLGINNPYDLIGRTLHFLPNYAPPPTAPPPTVADLTKSYVMY